MTSLEDKAYDDGPEVVLASDSAGVYRLRDDELTKADDIRGPDEFPEYGEFLDVARVRAADGNWTDGEPVWLECPAALAGDLVEADVTPGDTFALSEPNKSAGGNWQYTVQNPDSPQDLL